MRRFFVKLNTYLETCVLLLVSVLLVIHIDRTIQVSNGPSVPAATPTVVPTQHEDKTSTEVIVRVNSDVATTTAPIPTPGPVGALDLSPRAPERLTSRTVLEIPEPTTTRTEDLFPISTPAIETWEITASDLEMTSTSLDQVREPDQTPKPARKSSRRRRR